MEINNSKPANQPDAKMGMAIEQFLSLAKNGIFLFSSVYIIKTVANGLHGEIYHPVAKLLGL